MTENNRFTVHIRWFNYEKTEGEIELFDNGQPLLLSEDVEDVQYIKTLLNNLHEENQRLTDKLNQTALELVGVISQGKAVEISEMSYNEFLDYRAENGKPMELQL